MNRSVTRLFAMIACVGACAAAATATSAPEGKKDKEPAATAPGDKPVSDPKGVSPGATAPDFVLKDLDGKEHRLSDYTKAGKIVVLEWFNPDCPFVKKHHDANKTFADMAKKYADKNVVFLAINSGAAGKQGAGLERNKKAVTDHGIAYPVLLDESGTVGRAYNAKRTPEMFIIGTDGKVAYMGAIDDDPSAANLGKTNYVVRALDEILAGKPVSKARTDAYGCTIKY